MIAMRKSRSDCGVPKYSDAEIIERNSIPEPNSGCWLWCGSVNSWGYGRLDKRSERQAHRLSYLTFKGPISPDALVLHSCDVTCCVNPDHLRLGTGGDNVQDAIARGRHVAPRGNQHPNAKLTPSDVVAIRSSAETVSELARRFNVSRRAIRFVKDGVTWKN
jgi:hypothetical protein